MHKPFDLDAAKRREPVEFWKAIEGEPDYEVSSFGRVRSWKGSNGRKKLSEPRILKHAPDGGNYRIVGLSQPGRGAITRKVHRLVCAAFHGAPKDGQVVRHISGVINDNRAVNLCWGTTKDNADDSIRHGTMARGMRHGKCKLTEERVTEIRGMRGTGASIARLFGVSETHVSDIRRGKVRIHADWKKVEVPQ